MTPEEFKSLVPNQVVALTGDIGHFLNKEGRPVSHAQDLDTKTWEVDYAKGTKFVLDDPPTSGGGVRVRAVLFPGGGSLFDKSVLSIVRTTAPMICEPEK